MQAVIARYCSAPCVQCFGSCLDRRVVEEEEEEVGESTGMAVYTRVEVEGKLSTDRLVQEEVGSVVAGKCCASGVTGPSSEALHDTRVCWNLLA